MSRIALFTLLLFALVQPALAGIELSVEPEIATELDTLLLTLRFDGTTQTPEIDLDPLKADFDILGQNTSSQFRSINGQVSSWVELKVSLRARRTGLLTIGPLDVDGERSPSVQVQIQAMPGELRQSLQELVFFETAVSASSVYVQSELIYTRKLYYSAGTQMYNDLPGAPTLEHAVVLTLNDGNSYTETRAGRRYGVVEQRYAIFPERSGPLTIPGTAITSSIRYQANGRTRRTALRITAEPVAVEVLPIPADYPADVPWLPARELTINDRLDPATAEIAAGTPMTRRIEVQVLGNLGSAIPETALAPRQDNLRQYPDNPEIGERLVDGRVLGIRQQSISMVPLGPGTTRLPGTEITWWDVEDNRVRTTRSPDRSFLVLGNAASAPAVAAVPQTRDSAAADDSAGATEPVTPESAGSRASWLRPLGLSGVMLLLILAGIGARRLWFRQRRRSRSRQPSSMALARHLREACARGDAADIRKSLIEHAAGQYGMTPAQALQQLYANPAGRIVLEQLAAARFGPGTPLPDAAACLAASRALAATAGSPKDGLPPLYPV